MLAMKTKEYFFFYTWFLIVGIPMSYMMGAHTFPWQASHSNDLFNLRTTNSSKLDVLHFLSVDCECSKSVFQKLISREPRESENEKVFIMGKNLDWEAKLKAKNYHIETNDMDYFAKKYDVKAVPQLIIINDDKILYAGGYSSIRSPSTHEIEDEKIISESLKLKKENSIERPIFGCVTGRAERKLIDPFHLKYK